MNEHNDHFIIPALDAGVTPVGKYELYCTECDTFFEENYQ